MRIIFHKNFEKQYKKLPRNIQLKVQEKNIVFEKDPYNLILNNHALHGKYNGYRSINITGNVRVIYKILNSDTVLFTHIGTHGALYV